MFIACGCNEIGMQNNACDSVGQCNCKRNFRGTKCDQCALGFYKYPECLGNYLYINSFHFNVFLNFMTFFTFCEGCILALYKCFYSFYDCQISTKHFL